MKFIIIYLFFINIISFFCMYIDKRRAIKNKSRISENKLLLLSIIGGSLGALSSMYLFRHKTKKFRFKAIFILSLILHIYIIYKLN